MRDFRKILKEWDCKCSDKGECDFCKKHNLTNIEWANCMLLLTPERLKQMDKERGNIF
jgi:hypothetical protein